MIKNDDKGIEINLNFAFKHHVPHTWHKCAIDSELEDHILSVESIGNPFPSRLFVGRLGEFVERNS